MGEALSKQLSDLPNRIRDIRKQRRLTLKQLAPLIGTSFGHLQRMEVGDRELSLTWMREIGTALDALPSDLLTSCDGGLTQCERGLVDTYRSCSPQLRAMLDALVKLGETDGSE